MKRSCQNVTNVTKRVLAQSCPGGAKRSRESRYKFDRSQKTVTVQDFCWGHWCSVAVQNVSEAEISQGAGFLLGAGARVRVQDVKRIYMASRAGNDDK